MEERYESPDEVFGFMRVLEVLTDTKIFNEWLSIKHYSVKDSFDGHKFIIGVSLRRLINAIVDDESLGFQNDDILRRADFTGADIRNLPNSCDKIKIIKFLSSLLSKIDEASSIDELDSSLIKLKEVITTIRKIFSESSLLKKIPVDKDKLLNYLGIYWTYVFLVDTQRGYPQGFYVSVLSGKLDLDKLRDSFKGYQLALKYLFEVLYDEDLSGKKILDLDKSETLFNKEEFRDPFDDYRNKKEDSLWEIEALKWKSIDKFHSIVREDIIEPIEKKIGETFMLKKFFKISINPKDKFNFILKETFEEPSYLKNNDKKSIFKQLDVLFLFYSNVEVIDSKRSKIFSGVPVFIYNTKGFADSKFEQGIDEPVKVIRFVHPEKGIKNGHNYSYAVLIESYGGISDHSGWMIFYDCCGDYSGFSGSQHDWAEEFIKKYKKEGMLEIKE